MIQYHDLDGRRRRRHLRLFRKVLDRGEVYVRTEAEFRMVERMHRIGMLTACVSKWNWIGPFNGRPFRELAVFPTEQAALARYDRILPRRR